jgi:hypothetical protein
MRNVKVTLSRSTIFLPFFSWIVQLVLLKKYSHSSLHFIDPYTGQEMVSETSQGEAHEVTFEKWKLRNKIVRQWEITVSEEQFKEFKIISNGFKQTHYAPIWGLIGILFNILSCGKLKWFEDDTATLFCSESDAYKLACFGVHFLKDRNFITPKDIEKKLDVMSLIDERFKRII